MRNKTKPYIKNFRYSLKKIKTKGWVGETPQEVPVQACQPQRLEFDPWIPLKGEEMSASCSLSAIYTSTLPHIKEMNKGQISLILK